MPTQTQDYPSVHLGKKIERQNEVKVSGNPVQSQLCYSIVSHSQVSITSVVSFKCDTQFSQSILSLRCVTHFCQSVVSISSVVQFSHSVESLSLVPQFSHSVVVRFLSSELSKAAATEVRRPSIKC